MNYWVIADTHFGHKKLVEIGERGEGFEEKIFIACRQVLYPGDVLIHLGDVALKNEKFWNKEFLKICCKDVTTILVRGNHDNRSVSWYLNAGWSFVVDNFCLKQFGVLCVFSHEPLSWPTICAYDREAMYEDKKFLNIHGHIHEASPYRDFYYNVLQEFPLRPKNFMYICENIMG